MGRQRGMTEEERERMAHYARDYDARTLASMLIEIEQSHEKTKAENARLRAVNRALLGGVQSPRKPRTK